MCIAEFLFYFGLFNQNSRNKLGQNFFPNLTLLSRASPVGMIYKEVTSCVLTQLKGQARAEPMMWHHVGASHAKAGGTTKSHQMTWRDCWEV
jgi:hypothetical protein